MSGEETSMLHADAAEFGALAQQVLARGETFRFRARGRSMHPGIHDGDVVTVTPRHEARRGDVVLYRTKAGGLVLHRILDITRREGETILKLRGDAAGHAPDEVAPTDILGLVVSVSREGRERRIDTLRERARGLLRVWLRSCQKR